MKKIISTLLFLPFAAWGQEKTYYSLDGSLNFAHTSVHYTGYSINVGGGIKLMDQVYLGASTGALRVKPILKGTSVPLTGRLTFFTSNDESSITPFLLVEYGKLFHRDKFYIDEAFSYLIEGRSTCYSGVGVRFNSEYVGTPFFSVGYQEYNYDKVNFRGSERSYDTELRPFRRFVVRLGFMLP